MPFFPKEPKETKEAKEQKAMRLKESNRINAEIDSSWKRRLRAQAVAREREEANKERRAAKARKQARAAGAGGGGGGGAGVARQSVRGDDRLPFLRTLGLTAAQDTVPEIKSAYKRLALLYHPDKNPAGEAQMKTINTSYEALLS
jgi:hypothetical protein